MEKFVIEGGEALSGTLTPAGNKNGALAILAACVLSADEVARNVLDPRRPAMLAIRDRCPQRMAGAHELPSAPPPCAVESTVSSPSGWGILPAPAPARPLSAP
jgi:hypothetical protein